MFFTHKEYTMEELYSRCMKVETEKEAKYVLKELIKYHSEKYDMTKDEAETVVRFNIGYYSGYNSKETRQRVKTLFNIGYQLFGYDEPDATEAFTIGLSVGEKLAKQM